MALFGTKTSDPNALPTLETTPAAQTLRLKRDKLAIKMADVRNQLTQAIADRIAAKNDREAKPFVGEIGRLTPRLHALPEEQQQLRLEERALLQPTQDTIGVNQGIYNDAAKPYLEALEHCETLRQRLVDLTQQAQGARVVVRGCHGSHWHLVNYVGQVKQFWKEMERTP